MIALELLYISLTVTNLTEALHFYCKALGFTCDTDPADAPPQLATLFGASSIRTVTLRRGKQFLELAVFDPPGSPYPSHCNSDDLRFQHCALVTRDIYALYDHIKNFKFTPISRHGPELLPGGIIAFKFRDPDGHPLELIQFPQPKLLTDGGIDHSAISVANADKSIAFYEKSLGLRLQSRQQNTGPAQDALDNLDNTYVDVVALISQQSSPHLELLNYKYSLAPTSPKTRPADRAATRQVYLIDSLDHVPCAITFGNSRKAALMHDPDGHSLLLLAKTKTNTDQ